MTPRGLGLGLDLRAGLPARRPAEAAPDLLTGLWGAWRFDTNLPVYDLYVNGVLADTASNNDNLVDPAGTRVFVAATNSGISTPIDMALAYTVRLDAAQVAALYNAGIGYDPTA